MPRRNSKITERWKEASEELANATGRSPEDLRFSWEKAQDDANLPTYENLINDEPSDSGFVIQTAPTKHSERPRALTIGYNSNTQTLLVVFRDNTWWQYNDVPPDVWLGLQRSSSTGEYLKESGLDAWSSMGPADMESLSEGIKAQISQNALVSSDIQSGDKIIEKAFEGEFNLRSITAEELFKQ